MHKILKRATVLFIVAGCVPVLPPGADACTTFCLSHGKDLLFGRSYDFPIGNGLVIVNKRNVWKTAMANADEQAAHWTSTYGSVTFNQFGRDNPMGGMNEMGLIVELMQLQETQYPDADARPVLGCLEWIQYQLDNSATVQEVIKNAEAVRIRSEVGIHYLIADSNGEAASIEFLEGRLVFRHGDNLPVKALANSTYKESVAYLQRCEGANGKAAIPTSMSSLDRFVRAGMLVKSYMPQASKSALHHAFDILRNVAQGAHTQWSIVYDVRNLAVHFLTREARQVRHLDLNFFDFACASPVKILEVNADLSGDVTPHFVEYTLDANRELVMTSFPNSPFTRHVPVHVLEQIAQHPGTSSCRNLSGARRDQ